MLQFHRSAALESSHITISSKAYGVPKPDLALAHPTRSRMLAKEKRCSWPNRPKHFQSDHPACSSLCLTKYIEIDVYNYVHVTSVFRIPTVIDIHICFTSSICTVRVLICASRIQQLLNRSNHSQNAPRT